MYELIDAGIALLTSLGVFFLWLEWRRVRHGC